MSPGRQGGKTWPLCSVDRGCRQAARLSSEEVPILFSVIARLSPLAFLSLWSPLSLLFDVSLPLSLVGPLMLSDGLSWVLSVEPPAPCARLSPSQSVSLCLLRGPLLPHLLFIVVPQTFPPSSDRPTFQLFSPSFFCPSLSLCLPSPCPLVVFVYPMMPWRPHSTLSLAFWKGSQSMSPITRLPTSPQSQHPP